MTKAVLATFSDAKTIKTRSVLQIVLEIPIEQADEAVRLLGGFPQPASERWVEVVLHEHASKPTSAPAKPKDKTPEKWADMKPSKQAGIRCNEPEFWNYLNTTLDYTISSSEHCAVVVRKVCKVASRSEFDTQALARQRWAMVESGYDAFKQTKKYAETAK